MGGITSWVGDVFGGGNKAAKQGRQQQVDQYQAALQSLRDQYGQGIDTLKNVNEQQGPSAMANVKVNPALRQAQMRALGSLQGEGAAGGMTAQDRLAQTQALQASDANAAGQRGAIMQNAAARGAASGGQALEAQLAGQQQAATQNAQTGMNQVAQSRQRALQAMQGAGQLGGQMENQQFGEQAQAAQAADAINKFNAGQRLNKAGSIAGMYGGLGNQLAGGQRSLGDVYHGQGQEKKAENRDTWGGAGDIVGSVLSFL